MRLLLHHQIGPGQQGHADAEHAQHLDDRPGQGVEVNDPHGLVVVLLGGAAKSAPFLRFARERLDDLDALESLLQDLVNGRHAFELPARGPLHRLAHARQKVQADRNQHQKHERELPADPAGDRRTGDGPERLGHHPAEQRLGAGAEHFDVVGEAGHQLRCVPDCENWLRSC